MTSETRRDPLEDHLLTPENSAFIIIDFQPIQVSSIRSMDQKEMVFNIVSTARAALNYDLPIVHSTVNRRTGANEPPRSAARDADRRPDSTGSLSLGRDAIVTNGAHAQVHRREGT